MSVCIKLSDLPGSIWFLQNEYFKWFGDEVIAQVSSEKDVLQQTKVSLATQAFIFPLMEPKIADRLKEVFLTIGAQIADGRLRCPLVLNDGTWTESEQNRTNNMLAKHFGDLVTLLTDHQHIRSNPAVEDE